MCKHITLFPSLNDEENNQVLTVLRKLKKNKTIENYEIIADSAKILDGYVNLPSILTDEGYRASGVKSIKHFLAGPVILNK